MVKNCFVIRKAQTIPALEELYPLKTDRAVTGCRSQAWFIYGTVETRKGIYLREIYVTIPGTA